VCRHLLYGEWDYAQWRIQYLKDYTMMCSDFIEEVGGVSSAVDRAAAIPGEPERF
jgi:hypothetical protein